MFYGETGKTSTQPVREKIVFWLRLTQDKPQNYYICITKFRNKKRNVNCVHKMILEINIIILLDVITFYLHERQLFLKNTQVLMQTENFQNTKQSSSNMNHYNNIKGHETHVKGFVYLIL